MIFKGIHITFIKKVSEIDFENTMGVAFDFDFFEGAFDHLEAGLYLAEGEDEQSNDFYIFGGNVIFLHGLGEAYYLVNQLDHNPLLQWADQKDNRLQQEAWERGEL